MDTAVLSWKKPLGLHPLQYFPQLGWSREVWRLLYN
jgi:hypothetical protein